MENPLNFSQALLDKFKNYNRPVRMIIWVIIVAIAFLYLIFVRVENKPVDPLAEVMIVGMFADLGIYGVLRTTEKNLQAKIEGNKDVVDKIGENDNIEGKANIDVKNDS